MFLKDYLWIKFLFVMGNIFGKIMTEYSRLAQTIAHLTTPSMCSIHGNKSIPIHYHSFSNRASIRLRQFLPDFLPQQREILLR